MTTEQILTQLAEAELFRNTIYNGILEQALVAYAEGRPGDCEQALNSLPTKKELLENLLKKLVGKPVHKTLAKLNEGSLDMSQNPELVLKALFSLGTHTCIECEQGNREYKVLLPVIYEKIGAIIFSVSKR